jgi:hypothetical protein
MLAAVAGACAFISSEIAQNERPDNGSTVRDSEDIYHVDV